MKNILEDIKKKIPLSNKERLNYKFMRSGGFLSDDILDDIFDDGWDATKENIMENIKNLSPDGSPSYEEIYNFINPSNESKIITPMEENEDTKIYDYLLRVIENTKPFKQIKVPNNYVITIHKARDYELVYFSDDYDILMIKR